MSLTTAIESTAEILSRLRALRTHTGSNADIDAGACIDTGAGTNAGTNGDTSGHVDADADTSEGADARPCVPIGPFTVRYTDAGALYMEYKDIFVRRIYQFDTAVPRPRIIDGGACIGMATLYFKSAYPDAEIIAFEPDAEISSVFQQNIDANALSDVQVINAGLAGDAGTHDFAPDGADGGRIVKAGMGEDTIQTVRLSDYLDAPIDLLKLNIEGRELDVLREVESAGRLANVRQVILEYHGWADGRQNLGPLLELLDRNGFRYVIHDFDDETNPASKPPFRMDRPRTWFCLVSAKRMGRAGGGIAPVPKTQTARPIDWRDLRSVEPVSRVFGSDRGTPIDRHYIEGFLQRHREDIQGRVLEIGDATYTRRFGGDRVTRSDVLHVDASNPKATIIGDLATGDNIPNAEYDCIILTQTLPFIHDVRPTIQTVHRALAPGGVVLATCPGISQISRYDMDRWGDYWRFTSLSLRMMLEAVFGSASVAIETHGNVLVACAFLQGLAVEDLAAAELDYRDRDYELIITARAQRSGAADSAP